IEALATSGQELVVLIGELPFIASDRLTERLVDGDGQIGSIRRSGVHVDRPQMVINPITHRSEEHTSELQSRFDLVCRLLLEKKNSRRIGITGEDEVAISILDHE